MGTMPDTRARDSTGISTLGLGLERCILFRSHTVRVEMMKAAIDTRVRVVHPPGEILTLLRPHRSLRTAFRGATKLGFTPANVFFNTEVSIRMLDGYSGPASSFSFKRTSRRDGDTRFVFGI